MLRWILLLCFLLLQTACDAPADGDRPDATIINQKTNPAISNDPTPVTYEPETFEPLTATDLLNEPTPVYRFETTAEALSVWRRAAEQPTLLLLSNNPHLKPVPKELQKAATILISNADVETLAKATTDRNPAPILLSGMAIDAALRNGWLKEMAWALPLRDPEQALILEKFNEQLSASLLATEDEITSLELTEKTIHGTLRGTTFSAAALPLLQEISGPVIVHIDLGYFQPLYKNEIATPLLDIVSNTLGTLKKMNLETLAVTFSYGHIDSQISLNVRFLGDIIAYLIEDPTRLEQPIPVNFERQRDSLYLANFFQKEKIRELFEAQVQEAPDTGWVYFNLYRSAAEHKEGSKALASLAKAVELDPMFALEYLELSNMAYEKQHPDEALRMLVLEADAFPDDPFIKLQIAQLANELGQKDMSLEMLNKIRNLDWSEIYYPQMPQYLTDLTSFVQSGEVPTQTAPSDKKEVDQSGGLLTPEAAPSRQRIMHAK